MFFYVMAGFDTTSTTLSFVFLLLALHPSDQIHLQKHLDEVLGDKPPVEWGADDDLQKLLSGFLGCIISETLRLYHPVAWYARKTVRQASVTDSKGVSHVLPAGTTIMIDLAALGRHPSLWPVKDESDILKQARGRSPALQFNPSRWLVRDRAAFAFSAGHRMCPGKKFAETEMCAMIARFFKQFSLRLVPHHQDILQCERLGFDKARLDQMTRERAATAMFKDLEFGHGIYPRSHTPFEIVARG